MKSVKLQDTKSTYETSCIYALTINYMREKLAISFTIAPKTMKYFEINLTKKKRKTCSLKTTRHRWK